jgi:hypothetical protein
MSDAFTKIGMTCAAIVVGAAVVGWQLSNSPGLLQDAVSRASKAAGEEDKVDKAARSDADTSDEDEDSEAADDVEVADDEDGAEEPDSKKLAKKEPHEDADGDVSAQEEPAEKPDSGTEAADNSADPDDADEADDGEVVYNGIPAGTVTEDE